MKQNFTSTKGEACNVFTILQINRSEDLILPTQTKLIHLCFYTYNSCLSFKLRFKICNLRYVECEERNIASYADDTTPYSCAVDIQTVISSELKSLANFFTGFSIIILKPILEYVIYF